MEQESNLPQQRIEDFFPDVSFSSTSSSGSSSGSPFRESCQGLAVKRKRSEEVTTITEASTQNVASTQDCGPADLAKAQSSQTSPSGSPSAKRRDTGAVEKMVDQSTHNAQTSENEAAVISESESSENISSWKCLFFNDIDAVLCVLVDTSNNKAGSSKTVTDSSQTESISKEDCTSSTSALFSHFLQTINFSNQTSDVSTIIEKFKYDQCKKIEMFIERGWDKECEVCLMKIKEKPEKLQNFGLLENCMHCFCFTCIRDWRDVRQLNNKFGITCPMCRTRSYNIIPSKLWLDTKYEKDNYVRVLKYHMSKLDCPYFKMSLNFTRLGMCPHGNECLRSHVMLDGAKINVGPPRLLNPNHRPHKWVIDFLKQHQNYLLKSRDLSVKRPSYDSRDFYFFIGYTEFQGFTVLFGRKCDTRK